jgi:hypothetical protein
MILIHLKSQRLGKKDSRELDQRKTLVSHPSLTTPTDLFRDYD